MMGIDTRIITDEEPVGTRVNMQGPAYQQKPSGAAIRLRHQVS